MYSLLRHGPSAKWRSPPPYVYSLPGHAPPLCTVSSGRASVYCLAAGRALWHQSQSCSFLVRRCTVGWSSVYAFNYNGCQTESVGVSSNRPRKRATAPRLILTKRARNAETGN
eukprot:scaffold120919_cov66-Phaeocystis_antarctica.AAC.2